MNDLNNQTNNETGIGGWLILILIGLIVTPIRLGISHVRDIQPLLSSMSILEAYPQLQKMLYIEMTMNIVFGAFAIVLLMFMLSKSSKFPKLMVVFYVSNLAFLIFDTIYVSQLASLKPFLDSADSTKEIIVGIIRTVIWVPYMLTSTRVKRTFIK